MNEDLSFQVQILKSIFKGREDVFAVRWEKPSIPGGQKAKSGYMPAYSYDPYLYRTHKIMGGTFQNYKDKTYLQLTEKEIEKHLKGEQQIGIYPLLSDNTSWFLVADFDKENWIEAARLFIKACQNMGFPAYLERSRSGNGGHVWLFFEQAYPAIKSRKIFISILEQAGVFSMFDKSSSFDRLFPNQDFHSGRGLGNLIALPLFKKSFAEGNSCFLNIGTLQPVPNQWQFLQELKRIALPELDRVFQEISGSSIPSVQSTNSGKLVILLNNIVRISRDGMTTLLINFLKEELNFANSAFIIKKKIGKGTFGTERYFKLVEETDREIIIPRGFVGKLIRFCREHQIDYNFFDERKKQIPTTFSFNAQLREHQQKAIDGISRKDLGVIVAPPGSGKTIVALRIISDKLQPAMIIVHRRNLLDQWVERIEAFLGIPRSEIGKIGQGKSKVGKRITVATIQSLTKELKKNDGEGIQSAFGIIILDECHHIPAETFRNSISKLQTFYLYGLTATPFRKYNDGKLIFAYLGEIISELTAGDINSSRKPKIFIRNTELDIPFNSKTDNFETLSKIMVHDSLRNKLILEDVKAEIAKGKRVVIITERKEHIDSLFQYLKQAYETITLSGEDSEFNKKAKWKVLKDGSFQALITTGQFFGEGTDLQNINCLFLVYPFSFEGKLIQYIGRVQRSEVTPIIYDYRDIKIDYLNKLFLKRNTYYRKIDKQATLFDEPIDEISNSEITLTIDKTVKISIEALDFRFGRVAFKYKVHEMNYELEFELENHSLRPEFDVLKPYFSKAINSDNIQVAIYAEFENGNLVAQQATSADVEKINQEVIEGVKFKFITREIIGHKHIARSNLLTVKELQDGKQELYANGQKLLEEILNTKDFKHSQQLRYLAGRHEGMILKIRFVLSPFSFVFLLSGELQFHIILETLDTEEATYLWHADKNKPALVSTVKQIDQQLALIRTKGRQAFLDSNPENFSRIVHDYSDEKKGFIIWKDLLEEQLG
jgi:superfamily II DNA or RNA helicase